MVANSWFTFENIIRLLVVVVGGTGVGAWLIHFFASGEVRLADRRKDKDVLVNDITDIRLKLDKEKDYTSVVKLRLNRLVWAWNDHREFAINLGEAIEKKEDIPPMAIRSLQKFPTSEELLKDLPFPTEVKSSSTE